MTDTQAPERIIAWAWETDRGHGEWDVQDTGGMPYIRADLHAAAEARARESALDALAAYGQANEAYAAQQAAEAERDALAAQLATARADALLDVDRNLRALLTGPFSSLTIGFNEDHACNYETAEKWPYYEKDNPETHIDWVSEVERVDAIAKNSVWTLQWYPATPVGFCCVGASSFSAIMAAAIRALKGDA